MSRQSVLESLTSYAPPLSRPFVWASAVAVVLASVRGIIVVITTAPPALVYQSTAILLLLLAGLGFIERGKFRVRQLTLLKNLMIVNLLLGVINIVVDLVLGAGFEPGNLYMHERAA